MVLPTNFRHWLGCAAAAVSVVVFPAGIAAQRGPGTAAADGVLEIVWRDEPGGRHDRFLFLASADGRRTPLTLSPQAEAAFAAAHGSVYDWRGKSLRARGHRGAPAAQGDASTLAVTALDPAADGAPSVQRVDAQAIVSGSRPYVSLLCKFGDVAAEPKSVAYHQNLLGGVAPGMDQYWRQISYDNVNVVGSQVVGWLTLPYPRSSYFNVDGSFNLGKAATDCTAAADPQVYFPNFSGINLMFNDMLDCCAWGGSWFLTLDGMSRSYATTWEPPWGQVPAVISHEMGHSFGLPHSADDYGHTYGSSWDVMSNTYTHSDPAWTWIGQETIAYHRDRLGWIPPSRTYTPGPGTNDAIVLQRLGEPLAGTDYLMAKIPVRGTSNFFTVEVRQKTGSYDQGLPATGVVIHSVVPGRVEPAHVIDHDMNGNAKDSGAALGVGGVFTDASSGIRVTVVAAGTASYTVRIRDGFKVSRPVDFTGDGASELAVFRPSVGGWFVNGGGSMLLGRATDVLVPGDYNGDRMVDRAVYRPSTGEWFIEGQPTVTFGQPGDVPVPADYDANGSTDIAVFRAGSWFIRDQATRALGQAGDVPLPGDYDGNGAADAAVFRPSTAHWLVQGGTDVLFGSANDIPVPADFNGDGVVDLAVFRPTTGAWHIRNLYTLQWGAPGDIPLALDLDGLDGAEPVVYRPSTHSFLAYNLTDAIQSATAFGQAGDRPLGVRPGVMPPGYGDTDADRRADSRVFRPTSGAWFTLRSSDGAGGAVPWGTDGDIPVYGDFDGDGTPDVAVFRPGSGVWYWIESATGMPQASQFGTFGDRPLPADYDGDGRSDLAVFRPSSGTWYVRYSGQASPAMDIRTFGTASDIPQPGDYDGDGRADYAVFRPSNGGWYVLRSSTAFSTATAMVFGLGTDVPVAGDWDGDGRTDIAVFRPSNGVWYVRRSWDGATDVFSPWGTQGDVPVAADFDGDGLLDPTVYRPSNGTWYTRTRPAVILTRTWGVSTDIPILQAR